MAPEPSFSKTIILSAGTEAQSREDQSNILAKKGDDGVEADEDDEDASKKKDGDPSAANSDKKKDAPDPKTDKNFVVIEEARNRFSNIARKNNQASENQIVKQLRNNPMPEIRAEAAKALGVMRRGLKPLHRAIETDGYLVRQAAYNSIAEIASKKSIEYFIRGTRSKYPEIKAASYKGLGRTRAAVGRELILTEGLKSQDVIVVQSAIEGLGYYNNPEDKAIFKKYIEAAEPIEYVMSSLIALTNHKGKDSLDLIYQTIEKNPKLGFFVRPMCYSIARNNPSFAATLVLVKLHQVTTDKDNKEYIEKLLTFRRAAGRYAMIKSTQATLRRYPNARGDRIISLKKGEIVKIKKIAPTRYKARIAGKVVEDFYYLVQLAFDDGIVKKDYLEGWVFGAKIDLVTFSKVAIGPSYDKETDDDEDEIDTLNASKQATDKDTKKKEDDDDDDD